MVDTTVPQVADEFTSLKLGDRRLDARVKLIANALQDQPAAGFPKAMRTDAASEAFYRFMSNRRVSMQPLLDAHVERTRARMQRFDTVLAIHDSSLMQFEGEVPRDGLFPSTKGKFGYLAHTCLAVANDGSRLPLGLLGMIPVVRPKAGETVTRPALAYANESERWLDLVAIVEDETAPEVRLIHVMDREGDAYPLLDIMETLEADFVVRLAHDRRVLTEGGESHLSELLPHATTRLRRTVRINSRSDGKRPPSMRATHPARDERVAELAVRVVGARFRRPKGSTALAPHLDVNIVHVVEINPPDGEEPVSWLLATTLPVDTAEQVAAVVDAYRARWLIEEFFKALKTGCAYQSRQCESLDTLLVAFALLAPVAWRLLVLRWLGRNEPKRPSTDVMSPSELACLRLMSAERGLKLPKNPSVEQVMFAIAGLGGFLKQNKVPGWQVLGRGWVDFAVGYRVYRMVMGLKGEIEEGVSEM